VRRRIVLGIAAFAAPLVAVACARAPEPRTNAPTDANLEPVPEASVDPSSDAAADGDARVKVPGLPMPQQFPRFVWDAAGAPRDAAAR
jgi:hypothetical protein